MNDNTALSAFALGLAAAGAWWYARNRPVAAGGDAAFFSEVTPEPAPSIGETIVSWVTPAKGKKFDPLFDAATAAYRLPDGMLSRMAYQESRYNPAAVSVSDGAQGLMQFMPATAADLGIDATDPLQAVWGAAKYVREQFDRFGTWALALAAYNWGPGNLARKGFAAAPKETRVYVASITQDIGLK